MALTFSDILRSYINKRVVFFAKKFDGRIVAVRFKPRIEVVVEKRLTRRELEELERLGVVLPRKRRWVAVIRIRPGRCRREVLEDDRLVVTMVDEEVYFCVEARIRPEGWKDVQEDEDHNSKDA